MVVNIPIRLVRADGGLIALDVTNLTLDIDRNINPHGLPYSGAQRFAFDLNMPKALILLEGYMVDAPSVVDTALGTASHATIDFSISGGSDFSFTTNPAIKKRAEELVDDELNNELKMTLQSTVGTNYDIYFTKSNTASGITEGNYWVSIINTSNTMRTAEYLAEKLEALINLEAGSSVLGAVFSATKHDSTVTASVDSVLKITQKVTGEDGNNRTPQMMYHGPQVSHFSHGKNSDAQQGFSAGDKVMQLFGILSNSIDRDRSDFSTKTINGKVVVMDGNKDGGYADYITGIQIPFNSTVGADGEKYVAKNFFMPTGTFISPSDKTPDKAYLASSEITNPDNEHDFSFIKGTITKATFVQIAGEPIYQFNIQFLPIDNII